VPGSGGVFISHITDEAPIADALKVYLHRCFGPDLKVFVSSDYVSIPTGEEWHRAILSGIRGASLFVVLLSRESVEKRWINFESGFAWGAGVKMLPLTVRGFAPGEVGFPLSQLQMRTLVDDLALESVVHAVADATGVTLLSVDNPSRFVTRLSQVEVTLPVKNIVLEPVLESGGQILRFRLSNTGNRDVELIEIEVSLPAAIVSSSWIPQKVPNVVGAERSLLEGVEYLTMWERPFEGQPDRRYGVFNALPRIVSPHLTARFSEVLRIPLRAGIEAWEREQRSVRYKVVARGIFSPPGCVKLSDVPVL
jgi:TIR domain